jgi:KDO2-lipid IV(A) lauroyltransferase
MAQVKNSTRFRSLRAYRMPRYWLTWATLGLMKLVAHLPFPVQIKIGQGLGLLLLSFARERRHVCEVNLRLCYPKLNSQQLRQLVKKTFISNGIGLIEVAIAWYREPSDFENRVSASGLEHLKTAFNRGKGVLLVSAHFSTIEIGAFLSNLYFKMDATYRSNKNALFDAAMYNGRIKHHPAIIDRKDIRGAMRSLKNGHILWYAPDQDYGPKHSVFVPFFGVEAATITATSRFANFNDSSVIFFSHYRNKDNSGYKLYFSPEIKDYPTEDPKDDAITINTLVENAIKKQPEQYLWLHKRFKTQATGKSARPY